MKEWTLYDGDAQIALYSGDTFTFDFPPNNSTEEKDYLLECTDENGCVGSTTFTVLHDLCNDYIIRLTLSANKLTEITPCSNSDIKAKYQYDLKFNQAVIVSLWRRRSSSDITLEQVTDAQVFVSDMNYGINQYEERLETEVIDSTLRITIDGRMLNGVPAFDDTFKVNFWVKDNRVVLPLTLTADVEISCPGFAFN